MKKYKLIVILLFAPFMFTTCKAQDERDADDNAPPPPNFAKEEWSGTVTWTKTSATSGKKTWLTNGLEEAHRWDKSFEYKIEVKFVNSKGTIVRKDYSNSWEKDSLVFVHKDQKYLIEETTNKLACNGSDTMMLEVTYDEDRKHYWIAFFTPSCPESNDYRKISNIYPTVANTSTMEHQGTQINLPANFTGEPIGVNPKVLKGSWQETVPTPNDPGGSGIITKATWSLTRK